MKKIIFVFVLFSISNLVFSQDYWRIGLSTYVYPGSIGIRWTKFHSGTLPDSSFSIYPKLAFEFRTSFAASIAGEGNVIMIQPELNGLFRLQHSANISLMSGLGIVFGYQNENDNFYGAYIPIVTEFIPDYFKGALSIKIEGDVLYKKYSNFSSISFRPLVGVNYNIKRKIKMR